MSPVIVLAQYGGGTDIVGTVDVSVATTLMTGARQAIEHTTIYNVPYLRIRGGKNALIIDPEAGDSGFCGFCSRDISEFVKNRKTSSPVSRRRHSFSDAVYIGGFSSVAPENYIMLKGGNVTIKTKSLTIDADSISIIGATEFTGSLKNNGKNVGSSHTHENSGGTGMGGIVS
jgi:hypothetical protein